MSDQRTGLSSFGQQLLDDLILDVRALVKHTVKDPEAFARTRADVAAELAGLDAPAPEPVSQIEVDALNKTIQDLQRRLEAQSQNAAPSAAVASATPSGAVEPAPAGSTPPNPFDGQTPMVPPTQAQG